MAGALLVTAFLIPLSASAEFLKGADLSALEMVEEFGGVFTDGGLPGDPIDILQKRGLNAARLRVWHTPWHGYNDLTSTLDAALRMKNEHLELLVDFHYSDIWADPGTQTKPGAWAALPFATLKDSVYAYTFHVISALAAQNTLPDIVQVGNEITGGMLWDDGRVTGSWNTPQQWEKFGELVKEGIRGVNDALGPGESVEIMLHTDKGGDNSAARYFIDQMIAEGVSFDLIGLSFYPWWHGTLGDLAANLNDLATRYSQEIVVVEASYPWSLGWADTTHNLVGEVGQLHPGYDATEAGQMEYLTALVDTLEAVPGGKCRGWFYWAPDWLADSTAGSPWENVTLFDFSGEILDGATAFGPAPTVGLSEAGETNAPENLIRDITPDPFHDSTRIRFSLPTAGSVKITVYNVVGREVASPLTSDRHAAGPGSVTFDAASLPSGIYFARVQSGNASAVRRMVLLR